MKRIQNFGGLSDAAISHCEDLFAKHEADAIAVNLRKAQFVFKATFGNADWIAKRYSHGTVQHRLASLLNQANADRYAQISQLLQCHGVAVPKVLLILKKGLHLLPRQTLLVMERVEGEMLRDLLPELEHDADRTEILVEKIAQIFARLRETGVFHRDLNAKNLLVTAENAVTLIDFDYAGQCAPETGKFTRRHRRDVETLLASSEPAPTFARTLSDRLRRKTADIRNSPSLS